MGVIDDESPASVDIERHVADDADDLARALRPSTAMRWPTHALERHAWKRHPREVGADHRRAIGALGVIAIVEGAPGEKRNGRAP